MCANRVIIVKGMTGRVATTLVLAFAKMFEVEVTSWLLSASSENELNKSFTEFSHTKLRISIENHSMQSVRSHLEQIEQKVFFVLDDVKDFTELSKF